MVQNAMQFAPKCNAFCRKTQSILVQNAVQNTAKCKTISINMRLKLGIMRFLLDWKQVFCMAKSG